MQKSKKTKIVYYYLFPNILFYIHEVDSEVKINSNTTMIYYKFLYVACMYQKILHHSYKLIQARHTIIFSA